MAKRSRKLRSLVENVVRETFARRKDVVSFLLCEAIEDTALANAVKEGSRSRVAGRKRINSLLSRR